VQFRGWQHMSGRHGPMSLPVAAMVQKGKLQNAECILCGNCVGHCQAGAIRYAFWAPSRTKA